MGSTASKGNKTIGTKNVKSPSRRQSNSDSNYTQSKTQRSSTEVRARYPESNEPAEQDGTETKDKQNETDLIKDREKGNDSDETKKQHTDHRTGENNDSSAVGVGDGLTIALPQNSTETLDVDPRSPNQIIQAEKAKKEEEKALKEEKEKQKREEIEKVKKGKEILQRMISSLKDQYDDSEMKYSLLKKAVTMMNTHQHKIDSTEKQLFKLDRDEQKQTKLRTLRQEKANLLHRLSEIASARLRHNNPDIADLSDENRATKLAERLSELYDNEWTDLFEVTKNQANKKINERVIAEDLRDILKFCYDICQRIANNQLVNTISCLNMKSAKDLQASPPELRLRLKEFQKNISRYSVPHIETTVSKEVAKSIGKERKEENIVVKCSSKTKKQYTPYINLCTEITWHMQIQDPPLVLDFGAKITDLSRFRPYTASGPLLDYVLWPAMLLHDNGPVVAKGVAQFKKNEEPSKKINEKDDKQPKKTSANDAKTVNSEW